MAESSKIFPMKCDKCGFDKELVFSHNKNCLDQAVLITKSRINNKLSPKLNDIKLYLDRKSPNISQVLRLISEIEKDIEFIP